MESLSQTQKEFTKIGMVARWQPVHLGHFAILQAMVRKSEHVIIGIGSSNTYNYRCPFTLAERQTMLELVLKPHKNYTIIPIPDLNDGPRWRIMVHQLFGELDYFITANPYVAKLMENDYALLHPVELLENKDKIKINGEMVRKAMAKGENWKNMVPEEIRLFIQNNHLDERFRLDFGLETLTLDTVI